MAITEFSHSQQRASKIRESHGVDKGTLESRYYWLKMAFRVVVVGLLVLSACLVYIQDRNNRLASRLNYLVRYSNVFETYIQKENHRELVASAQEVNIFDSRMDDLLLAEEQIDMLTDDLHRLQDAIDSRQVYEVKMSAYTLCPTETDDTPTIGATGAKLHPGVHIAVSQDLDHLLGREVYVHGLGVRRVEDLMASRWTRKIDILLETKEDAMEWGVRRGRITVIPEQD